MSDLAQQTCESCRANTTRLTSAEQAELLSQLSDWQILEKKGVPQLLKAYSFENFVSAMNFTNKLGEIAEVAGHHPAILTEWGRVTVSWWSHDLGGLHKNDFIMAAKTDLL